MKVYRPLPLSGKWSHNSTHNWWTVLVKDITSKWSILKPQSVFFPRFSRWTNCLWIDILSCADLAHLVLYKNVQYNTKIQNKKQSTLQLYWKGLLLYKLNQNTNVTILLVGSVH